MAAQEKEDRKIAFREVFLSDLTPIIQLYRSQKPATGNSEDSLLTADFGLPLGIAELDRKVIAYSFVNIDDSGTAVLGIHAYPEFEQAQLSATLTGISSKRFDEHWGMDGKIENAISRLINWLNSCY